MATSGLSRLLFAAAAFVALAASCSSGDDEKRSHRRGDLDDESESLQDTELPPKEPLNPNRSGPGTQTGPKYSGLDFDDPSKLIYLVSRSNELHSFNPKIGGQAAYHLVGKLDCKKALGTPQSMAVDRHGWAWVFYDSGQLFKVSVRDASCSDPTAYSHPSPNHQLGMGFTSVAPGSTEERLYIMSPHFGLATIGMPGLGVSKTGKLAQGAELTGGGDGKLFLYAATRRELSEVDLNSFTLRPVHSFSNLSLVGAWAFARFAGKFYLFTSDGYTPSRTTEYDPKTNVERIRDMGIGFVVVGAGQSTLVPPPDTDTSITGDWP